MLDERSAVGGPVGPMFVPRFRLFHLRADEQREQRRQPADEEHHAPAVARIPRVEIRIDREERERRQQVADRVALLYEARQQTPEPRRRRLERERRSHAPLAAHPDAEEHPQDQEHAVARRQPAQHGNDGVKHDVHHERDPPPEAVGHHAENDGPDRPHRQRHRDRPRNLRTRLSEGPSDVERVERPA